MIRFVLAILLAAGVATTVGGPVRAQDLSPEETKTRLERLEKQNQELIQYLQQMQVAPTSPAPAGPQATPNAPVQPPAVSQDEVKKIVGDYIKEQDAAKKAADDAAKAQADEEGYKVGTVLNMNVNWSRGYPQGIVFETPNKDFTMHPGAWFQFDNVFFTQSSELLTPVGTKRPGNAQGVASGPLQGGIGDLEDGSYFRRLFPYIEGTMYENYEYRIILALSNDQYSTVGLDEVWGGVNNIPWIGTARLGHVKTPMGFEGDMTGSSRTMTFMERSSYSESIELSQNFVNGLWLSNNYLDQHATCTLAAFRSDYASSSGVFFGDGQYGLQGRLTALPIWEGEGRSWLHLGLSGGWRNGSNNSATNTFQLRARPELRDDDPAADPSGGQPVPNADDGRMVDTGAILAEQEWLMGLELCYVCGPFSVQAEYGFNWIDNATAVEAPTTSVFTPLAGGPHSFMFSGGYIQLAYTLTGENRAYDKRYGIIDRNYFGTQGPYNNAWFVRGDDGRYTFNWGAWEIAARYSYLNLNSGYGLSTIQGGVMNGYTLGLNWYLNANFKVQFDYVYDQRSALPPDSAAGPFPGSVQGFGVMFQVMF
jgi:phosphate-selective porin OprO and OprP